MNNETNNGFKYITINKLNEIKKLLNLLDPNNKMFEETKEYIDTAKNNNKKVKKQLYNDFK